MISNGKELYVLIDSLLKPHAFVRKKDTYYLNSIDCICFLSIGKSSLGGHYDHAMGCFLKEIHQKIDAFPKFYKNDLKFGIGNFIEKEVVKKAFNLENNEFKNNERELLITQLIEKYVIPFLTEISSKEGIKKALNKYKDLKYYVGVDLKKALGIPYED